MTKEELERKYRIAGLPHGQIDTIHAVSNAHGILDRKHLAIDSVMETSLSRVHDFGYYTPYLNHRKISVFYINICSDSTPYDTIAY